MLFFNAYSLITNFFGSVFFYSLSDYASLGTSCSTSFPLLKVITVLTSSILEVGYLEELNSCTPLGLGYVWEGNFPFSCIC